MIYITIFKTLISYLEGQNAKAFRYMCYVVTLQPKLFFSKTFLTFLYIVTQSKLTVHTVKTPITQLLFFWYFVRPIATAASKI